MTTLALNTTRRRRTFQNMGSFLALVLLCVVMSILTPNFLTMSNVANIFKQGAVNALLSVGMLFCLITAGIDLSVGANAITCTCVIGMLHQNGVNNTFVLIAAAILTGTLIGFINGTLLTRLHLPHPFVSTLGMKNMLAGVALLLVGSRMVSGFGDGIMWLGSEMLVKTEVFPGFPVSYLLVIILYILMHVLLTNTTLGRSIYTVGGNREAARLSGINSANVLTFCYTISGFMAALAGIVLIGRGGIANGANAIQPYDTEAIAACIIGGASFMGGKGTMLGTLIGVMIITVLKNGLTIMAASSAIQSVVIGAVIIIAVLIDVLRGRLEEQRKRQATQKRQTA